MSPPQALVLLEIWAVTALVCLLAQPRPQRSFSVHLGRPEDGADIRWARMAQVVSVLSALTATVAFVLLGPEAAASWLALGNIVPTVVLLAGLIRAVAQRAPTPPPSRYAVAIDEDGLGVRDLLSPYLLVVHLGLLVSGSLVFLRLRPMLPDRVPMQFGFDGQVRRLGSPDELWMLGGLIAMNIGLVWLIGYGLAMERVALRPGEETRHLELQIERRQVLARMTEGLLTTMSAALAVMWLALTLNGIPQPPLPASPFFWLSGTLIAAGLVVPLALYLPRLNRVQDRLREVGGSETLGTRADGWKAGGLIYYAPDDPALFVPKAVGIGQTLNMARPAAWILLLALLAGPLLLVALFALT